jgi:hypothetical protein
MKSKLLIPMVCIALGLPIFTVANAAEHERHGSGERLGAREGVSERASGREPPGGSQRQSGSGSRGYGWGPSVIFNGPSNCYVWFKNAKVPGVITDESKCAIDYNGELILFSHYHRD